MTAVRNKGNGDRTRPVGMAGPGGRCARLSAERDDGARDDQRPNPRDLHGHEQPGPEGRVVQHAPTRTATRPQPPNSPITSYRRVTPKELWTLHDLCGAQTGCGAGGCRPLSLSDRVALCSRLRTPWSPAALRRRHTSPSRSTDARRQARAMRDRSTHGGREQARERNPKPLCKPPKLPSGNSRMN